MINVLQIGRQVSVDSGRGSLPSPTILENQLDKILEEQGQISTDEKVKQALANAEQLDKDYSKVYTNPSQILSQHINHEYSKIYVADQNLPLNGFMTYTVGHVQCIPVSEIDHGPDGGNSEVKDSGEGHSKDSNESYLDIKDIKMIVNSDAPSVAFKNQQGIGIKICISHK